MIANRGGPEAHSDWGGGGSGDIAPQESFEILMLRDRFWLILGRFSSTARHMYVQTQQIVAASLLRYAQGTNDRLNSAQISFKPANVQTKPQRGLFMLCCRRSFERTTR